MKLVIDIPEAEYNKTLQGEFNVTLANKAVKNGKPLDNVLDKIREEIKSKKFGLTDTEDGRRIQSDIHAGFDGGIECALQIIDKHRVESEEVK